jgi:hypothetical protein
VFLFFVGALRHRKLLNHLRHRKLLKHSAEERVSPWSSRKLNQGAQRTHLLQTLSVRSQLFTRGGT